jgi:hypothetical protein
MNPANNILKIASDYCDNCVYHISKTAIIKKLPGGKYMVTSEKGRNLGVYTSKEQAKKRLQQVEYFKHKDDNDASEQPIDLTKLEEFSYSSLMRELRKKATDKQFKYFLKMHKFCFDKAIDKKIKHPEEASLNIAFIKLTNKYKIQVNNQTVKIASKTDLGAPASVGKYLADIIKFILKRISPAKRQGSINRLKRKIYYLNENELALKKMPASSAMGQSITFVKTVLFNKDARYIRDVLNHLVRSL